MRVNEQTRVETRRALLDAAASAFARDGYHQTTIDSVSEAAGVAKGTIYNYFSSKEELLHALIEEACQLASAAADATAQTASTHARLEAFVAANLRWARQRGPLALLFARQLLAGDAVIKRLIEDAAAPCVNKVAAILRVGKDRGEIITDASPEVLAFTFIALANMLLLQSSESPMSWPRRRDLPTATTELFLHGIAAPGTFG